MTIQPFRMASTARSVPAALHARGKRTRKNLPSFFPRNPLISLDSDEKIQGNPTLIIGGIRSETARSKENPNGIVSATSRLAGAPIARLARPDSCPHHEASQRPDGGERGQAGAAREVDWSEMREH